MKYVLKPMKDRRGDAMIPNHVKALMDLGSLSIPQSSPYAAGAAIIGRINGKEFVASLRLREPSESAALV
jgi:hypothetical protein